MADLTTHYMGLRLRNPIIVASCGLTGSLDGIKRCADAGVGAVVLKSLFEEQFLVEEEEGGTGIHPEAADYMRAGGLLEYGPHAVVDMIERAKKEVDIPVIASLNCRTPELWPRYARQLQEAGADALELNIYLLPVDPSRPGAEYEDFHLSVFRRIKEEVTLPVSVKLNSKLTSVPHLGRRLAEAGCRGLVLFNWFLEPDIDIWKLRTVNRKGTSNFRESLKWVALCAGRLECDIAASGGVGDAEAVVKQILAGASVVQVCSLFYRKGVEESVHLVQGLERWMEEHRYSRIEDFRGEFSFKKQELRFRDLGEAEAYFRAQYLKVYGGAD